ncbi:beta-glucosidase [Eubacterium ruminantium]|nr:beta-glucosidase [Eubacterium ruminantium]
MLAISFNCIALKKVTAADTEVCSAFNSTSGQASDIAYPSVSEQDYQSSTPTVIKKNGVWCYVIKGKWIKNYTGFGWNEFGWWYCYKGRVDFGKTDVLKGKVKGKDGWWYVKDGKVQFTDTVARNSFGWWRIATGKVDFSYTGVAKNEYGWWYIKDGRLDFGYTGIARNEFGWWRIVNGKVDFSCNSVEKNEYGWWKISSGKVDFGFTGIASNNNGSWYCKDGKVQFDYSGTVFYDGKAYIVKGGKVISFSLSDPSDLAAEKKLSEMTLHEKICQMFLVTPESLTGYSYVNYAGEATREAIKKYPVAGVIYFGENLESRSQTEEMIRNTRQYAREINGIPFFIAVDEEGGMVARCADNLGTTVFDNMFNYKDQGTDKAYSNAYTIATDIKEIGFNLDFAPVADTWSNSENTVIGKRAYSNDFSETAELIPAAVRGFNDGGVLCTLKHFPGHGDTSEDSHSGSAYASKTLSELEKQEFLAFKSGIDAGADLVMVGHITMTGVDGLPAVFSHTMVTDQLRNSLGFEGVIVTDSLSMGAIANIYSSDEAAIKCINAGIDLLLMPNDLETAINGVTRAVENGTISEERINESVRRILRLKYKKL